MGGLRACCGMGSCRIMWDHGGSWGVMGPGRWSEPASHARTGHAGEATGPCHHRGMPCERGATGGPLPLPGPTPTIVQGRLLAQWGELFLVGLLGDFNLREPVQGSLERQGCGVGTENAGSHPARRCHTAVPGQTAPGHRRPAPPPPTHSLPNPPPPKKVRCKHSCSGAPAARTPCQWSGARSKRRLPTPSWRETRPLAPPAPPQRAGCGRR